MRLRTWIAARPTLRRTRDQMVLAQSYWNDWRRFRVHSGLADQGRRGLHAQIVMDAHRLEKGLALPSPRPWFGRDVIERLLENTELVSARLVNGGVDENYVIEAALGALKDYFEINSLLRTSRPAWTYNSSERTMKLMANHPPCLTKQAGGVVSMGPSALESSGINGGAFERFVRSRHSIRNFVDVVPKRDLLESAIALAATSPSVCNRQGSRVRIYDRGAAANRILAHQNGNKGFGHTASHVLLITQDLESFVSPGERNQAFVDGGMFAMTLMYALHASGLGSCALNWSRTSADDHRLRVDLDLPEHEVVVTLMAVGYPNVGGLVTRSPLRPSVVR